LGLKIKLDTNGYRPDILQKAFSLDLLDYAAMDIKGPLDSYSELAGVEIDTGIIKESIDIVKGSLVPYEFRTTVWDGYFNKYNDDSLLELVKNSKHYFLHNYYSVDKDSIHVPADRSEIADFLIKAEKIVDKVDLRGNWE
ncbi:MAG: hypothetical protein GY730_02845, partial [bacterium]|nr:hypothetical protein [bacterium]